MNDIFLKLWEFNSIDEYLEHLNKYVINLERGDSINIHLDVQSFITIEYFVITVGIIKYLRFREVEVNIEYNINTYAQRIDFYNQLGISIDESFVRHDSNGRFCEIREVNEYNSGTIVNNMIKVVERNCSLQDELIGCLNYCWYEIVGNIIEHSESPINGYVCVQSYPRENMIRVVILDCGIGIKNALSKSDKYSRMDEEDCLYECIKEGVTNGNGMGRGLYHTSEFIKNNSGKMIIYSGNHRLSVDKNTTNVKKVNTWQGTLVILEINTSVSVDIKDIFSDDIPTSVLEWNECVNSLW